MSRAQSVVLGVLVGLVLAGCSSAPNTLSQEEVEREKARSDAMHKEMDRQTP